MRVESENGTKQDGVQYRSESRNFKHSNMELNMKTFWLFFSVAQLMSQLKGSLLFHIIVQNTYQFAIHQHL